jgi:hypothetical protein
VILFRLLVSGPKIPRGPPGRPRTDTTPRNRLDLLGTPPHQGLKDPQKHQGSPEEQTIFPFHIQFFHGLSYKKEKKIIFSEKVIPDLLVFRFLKQLCYVTGDLCYREVINQFNEKYLKTTISYVALRKLVKKFVEIGSSLNVKKIRKYLDENDEASVLVFH